MTFEKYEGLRQFGDPISNEFVLERLDAQASFELMNAQEWIDAFKVEQNGVLDMDATAQKLGVNLVQEMPIDEDGRRVFAQACVVGLGKHRGSKPMTIHLNPDWTKKDESKSFGHEMGHIFLETAAGVVQEGGRDEATERFCEFFGLQVALPREELKDVTFEGLTPITALLEKYNVSHMDAFHQLMLVGKLPRRFLFDTGIGEVENPFYSGKVRRHCICVDCEIGRPHGGIISPEEEPVIDFSAVNWSHTTSYVSCWSKQPNDLDAFIELNKSYGRWTEADEALIDKERARDEEQRRVIGEFMASRSYANMDELF